jgi:hypothetical protein
MTCGRGAEWWVWEDVKKVDMILFLKGIKLEPMKEGEDGLVIISSTEIDGDTFNLIKKYA